MTERDMLPDFRSLIHTESAKLHQPGDVNSLEIFDEYQTYFVAFLCFATLVI